MSSTAKRGLRLLTHRIMGSSTRFVHGERYGFELPLTVVDPRRAERILSFLLAERLLERRHVHRPRRASLRSLRRVHTDAYLEALQARTALTGVLGMEVTDEQHDGFLLSHREQVGGTLLAARLALASGATAVNLGGGFHHALSDRGQGFCVFNDVAIGVADRRAAGFDERVLVVDLDLHDGDGTRAIFAQDESVHTFSIHNRHLTSVEAVESTSIALGDEVEDRGYLDAVKRQLPPVVAATRPGLAFYLAGCDPARDDRLGNWRIGAAALLERDRFVMEQLRSGDRPVPVVILLAGGYGQQAWRYSARFFSTLLHGGAAVEPPLTAELALAHYRKIARRIPAAELTRQPAPSDDWGLSEQDLDPAAGIGRRRTRFLDFYSRHGLEFALEHFGLFEKLRRLGHRAIRLELDLDSPGEQSMRIVSDDYGGESLIELRAHRDGRTLPGLSLLALDWLLIQNPAASFTAERPQLPGQRFPGLGLLGDVSAMLVLICERLQLDGMVFVPSHYHIAAQTRSYFRFVEPRAQARFAKLRQALEGFRLAEAIRVIEQGRLRDRKTGEPFRWEPSAMVLPVSQELRQRLDGAAYRDAAARFEHEFDYEL